MAVAGSNNGGVSLHVASGLLICKIGTVVWWHGALALPFNTSGGGGGGGGGGGDGYSV